jgi:hypothetical protein
MMDFVFDEFCAKTWRGGGTGWGGNRWATLPRRGSKAVFKRHYYEIETFTKVQIKGKLVNEKLRISPAVTRAIYYFSTINIPACSEKCKIKKRISLCFFMNPTGYKTSYIKYLHVRSSSLTL